MIKKQQNGSTRLSIGHANNGFISCKQVYIPLSGQGVSMVIFKGYTKQ